MPLGHTLESAMDLRIGCCGFPVAGAKYFRELRVVELQSTFYQLPQEKTAKRWREESPSDFEFVVKTWQAITHPLSSPTWRRVKRAPSKSRDKYGMLRPTRQNFEAWSATVEVCRLLRAELCVIQSPPRFSCATSNIRNMTRFFRQIDRDGLVLAWEPRGDWNDNPDQIRRVCEKLELIHAVDPLRRTPAKSDSLAYFRLHGLGETEVNYSYRYTDEDLSRLSKVVSKLAQSGFQRAYVMFNNIAMFNDAIRFRNSISAK
jgi:uncharacterized protein YecE (DUF72 family)